MKFRRILSLGVLAVGLAVFGSACGIFESSDEEEKDQFYRPLNGNGPEKIDVKDPGSSGEANLTGGRIDDSAGINGPGESQRGSGLSNYDGFGTPIPGVTFQTVYFRFDQSRIESTESGKLDAIANYLKSNPGTGVVIEGNCDARGSEEYNRALGERRALTAQEYLLEQGIAPSRMKTLSYGKEKLVALGNTEEDHMKNRRDDFVAVKLLNP